MVLDGEASRCYSNADAHLFVIYLLFHPAIQIATTLPAMLALLPSAHLPACDRWVWIPDATAGYLAGWVITDSDSGDAENDRQIDVMIASTNEVSPPVFARPTVIMASSEHTITLRHSADR